MAPPDLWPHAVSVDEATFAFVTELEIRKAVRFGYPVSLLALLLGVEGQLGTPGALAEQLARAISPILRATDLIRLSQASSTLDILLVDASLDVLGRIIERISEEVSAYLFQANGNRTTVTLSVGGACFPTTAGTAVDLLSRRQRIIA